MPNLTWFQYDLAAWEKRTRELALTLEEEGALMRLVRTAWQSQIPCTILDNEEEFGRILGIKWKRALPVLRQHFTPDPRNPGRLHCLWLDEMYRRAEEKHASYQERGKKGGRPRTKQEPEPELPFAETSPLENTKPRLEKQEPEPKISLARENTTEGFSCAPSEHTTKTPAVNRAFAPEGARAPIAERPCEPHTSTGQPTSIASLPEGYWKDFVDPKRAERERRRQGPVS